MSVPSGSQEYEDIRKSPWARIYKAAQRGSGCRLSAHDTQALMIDDAIETRGRLDAEGRLNEDDEPVAKRRRVKAK